MNSVYDSNEVIVCVSVSKIGRKDEQMCRYRLDMMLRQKTEYSCMLFFPYKLQYYYYGAYKATYFMGDLLSPPLYPPLSLSVPDVSFLTLIINTGYTPPHVCNEINETEFMSNYGLLNDSSIKFSYGKCDIAVYSNQTGQMNEILSLSCPNGRHFPGGKHMTLVSEWDLVCEKMGRAEIAQLMYTGGNVIGGLLVPYIADRFGRKPVLCISSIISMIIEFSIAFAPNMYYVCTALLLDGITYAGIGCTCMVLGMEVLLPQHRQVFGVVLCQYWIVSVLIVGLVAFLFQDVSWRYFQGTGALTGLLALTMPFLLYESPRWLAINGKPKEALNVLKKASKQNGKSFIEVKKTFEIYMKYSISKNNHNQSINTSEGQAIKPPKVTTDSGATQEANRHRYTLFSMLTRKDTLFLILIVWYLWTSCNLTYYGIYMSSSDLAGNRFLNYALLAIVEVPANFLVLFMMNRMGRLHVLRIFAGLAAISLLGSLLLDNFGNDSTYIEKISLALFVFGKFTVTSFFNALYIITPELFPTVLRSSGTGSCKSVPKIGSMLAPYTRPLYVMAKWAPGLIFTSLCFVALFLTFFLPETKDKILPTKLADVSSNKNLLNETKGRNEEV